MEGRSRETGNEGPWDERIMCVEFARLEVNESKFGRAGVWQGVVGVQGKKKGTGSDSEVLGVPI